MRLTLDALRVQRPDPCCGVACKTAALDQLSARHAAIAFTI
jgi:hypothetical protein